MFKTVGLIENFGLNHLQWIRIIKLLGLRISSFNKKYRYDIKFTE